jgi:hypothetical protein
MGALIPIQDTHREVIPSMKSAHDTIGVAKEKKTTGKNV